MVSLFYAVLTFEQMLTQTSLRTVTINDFSDNLNRGTIEGFYGIPWSHQSRKEIITMLGDFKMNQYYYAPKDDPYDFGPDWNVPYTEKELNEMKELVDLSNESHVDFIYTLHISEHMDLTDEDDELNKTLPVTSQSQWDVRGNDGERGVTVPHGQHEIDEYSADETWDSFIEKFDQMYNIGVRRFGILADDINFPQARYSIPYVVEFVNKLQAYFDETYDDVEPLIFVPTYYYKADVRYNGQTYYKYIKDGFNQQITTGMDSRVEVMWTGNHVMSDINHGSNQYFIDQSGREPLVWWNYPVTDYVPSYMLLGPNPGLEANATNMTGVIANPMQQGVASLISLFGVADYAWNMEGYDRMTSWRAAYSYLFPEVQDSLFLISQHATVGYNTNITEENVESEYLKPTLDSFKAAVEAKDADLISQHGATLTNEMDRLITAINDVRHNTVSQEMVNDLQPWLDKLESLSNITKYIVTSYTSEDTEQRLNAYSNIFNETSNWPSITVPQLAGGTVAAEIGIVHFKPFVMDVIASLETDINTVFADKDVLTNESKFFTNIKDIEDVLVEKEGTTYKVSDVETLDFEKYSYAGIKLDDFLLGSKASLDLSGKNADKLTVQYSSNGVVWTDVESATRSVDFDLLDKEVRYVRVINLTDETISATINEFIVEARGEKVLNVEKAESTTPLYQNNGAQYLVDGKLSTSYWTSSGQTNQQYVTIEFEEVNELYDFALFEDKNDYIRNGAIYVSKDGVDYTKVSTIGSNYVV